MELDPEMTSEQLERVSRLSAQDNSDIDKALREMVSGTLRKMARVIGGAMMDPSISHIKKVPDLYYAARLRKMIEAGEIVAVGNTQAMRFCEVKLADEKPKT